MSVLHSTYQFLNWEFKVHNSIYLFHNHGMNYVCQAHIIMDRILMYCVAGCAYKRLQAYLENDTTATKIPVLKNSRQGPDRAPAADI